MKWLVSEWSTHVTDVYNESADLGQSLRTDIEIIKPPHCLESLLPITVEKQMTTYAVDIHLLSTTPPWSHWLGMKTWECEQINE